MAIRLGVGATGAYEGWYRLIEAETVTRRQSEEIAVNDWLTLESSAHSHELAHLTVEACENVARRFGFANRPKTMVTLLAEETDAPWAVGRFGYMMDKYPYDKICIPAGAAASFHGFQEVVSHEYAHVGVLDVTQGRAPHWLNEAVAMLAEQSSDLRMRRAFASGEARWLSPRGLELVHTARRQGEPHPAKTWRAYQQSAWIGRYLVSLKGEEGIGELLRAFSDNSIWTEIKMRVTNQPPADEALRQVYGMSEQAVFDQALAWIQG
ncbi:hypothetical protein OP10G_4642 [Fimbriimonas ginsengisoli Gsoil 348]|uniref:Peptidase MA-like domain-containing protein n=2 Tax=Fimbriimonas ginsengisoli TaxID=1005039 RepID=A0A068NYC4_FIMGI|nr:hypothetical protein OP10G_4642 [Fimbriimonas ginsengisoli Gsoil 348]